MSRRVGVHFFVTHLRNLNGREGLHPQDGERESRGAVHEGHGAVSTVRFLGRAIQILKANKVKGLVTVNVLEDDDVRQSIKDYANWPTIPQLYVKGEFVGGSDILAEMHQTGELQTLLKQAQAVAES